MADLLQKLGLLRGLCSGDRAYTGPFYLTLDPTRRCNLHCLGCRHHSPEVHRPSGRDPGASDFPFERVEPLFSEIAALRTRTLFLVGDGEPFLHPRIFDIIRQAKKHGLHTTVTTNGTLIDEATAGRIVGSGLDNIHVSLWASSPESYARHYPGTDLASFQRVIDGLRALSSQKAQRGARVPYVTLLNPTSRYNYRDAEKMLELARETGCDAITFTPFKTLRGELEHYALSEDEMAERCRHLVALKKRIEAYSMGHNIERFLARCGFDRNSREPLCYVCWFHSRVKVDGTVVSCGRSELALGSLKTDRFTDIWNGAAYRRERRRRLSPGGRQYRNAVADCEGCGFVEDNSRIHRWFKYALPLLPHFRESHGRDGEG